MTAHSGSGWCPLILRGSGRSRTEFPGPELRQYRVTKEDSNGIERL
jgi:hypothetical protein